MKSSTLEVEVTADYLKNFPDPLWEKLDLQFCKPLSAIEGWQNGYRFIILNIRHRKFGLMGGDGLTADTTFFIVEIPASNQGRFITESPSDCDTSVDSQYVYLARPGKQARPSEWRRWVNTATKAVESLATSDELSNSTREAKPAYQPADGGAAAHIVIGVAFILASLLLAGVGLAIIFGLIDYQPDCISNPSAAGCRATTGAYKVIEGIRVGGGYLLGSGFFLIGALYSRERVRKRLRSKLDFTPDRDRSR